MLFGIITNPEMKARKEYYLKCLASRVSAYENTKKRYTVDWTFARVEEDKLTPIQDMDFVVNKIISPNNNFQRKDNSKSNTAFIDVKKENISPKAKIITIESLADIDFNSLGL
jgi:hypothetical protein